MPISTTNLIPREEITAFLDSLYECDTNEDRTRIIAALPSKTLAEYFLATLRLWYNLQQAHAKTPVDPAEHAHNNDVHQCFCFLMFAEIYESRPDLHRATMMKDTIAPELEPLLFRLMGLGGLTQ